MMMLNQSFIISILISLLSFTSISCVSSNSQHQHQQFTRTDHDTAKLLLKKAFEESGHLSRNDPLATSATSSQASQVPQASQVSASSLAANQQNFQCPEQFGYYTDTRDCTKYYVCVFGEVLHESCTGGLRFSRELQTCDWPRNVDCLQSAKNTSAQSSSIQVTSSGSSTSNSRLTLAGNRPTDSSASSLAEENSSNEEPSTDSSESEESSNNNRASSSKGSSLVFADEGSDPQQPSFDEAISPVITPDGAIHMHDGSGGTFSLQPNLNNNQREAAGQNVDVFVKPLQSANAALVSNSQHHNNQLLRPSSRQQLTNNNNIHRNNNIQQQQQTSSSSSSSNKPLQAATLPPTSGISPSVLMQQQQQQQRNQAHQHNSMSSVQQPPQTSTSSGNQFNSEDSSSYISDSSSSNGESNLDQVSPFGESSSAAGSRRSETLNENTSIASESVNDEDSASNQQPTTDQPVSSLDSSLSISDDENSSGDSSELNETPTRPNYVPPVLDATTAATFTTSSGQLQQQAQQQVNNNNNRQLTATSTFSGRQSQQNNLRNNIEKLNRQFSSNKQAARLSALEDADADDDELESQNQNQNARGQFAHSSDQNQIHDNNINNYQEESRSSSRQNPQLTMRGQNQTNQQHPQATTGYNAFASNNNRQSRMSSSFQHPSRFFPQPPSPPSSAVSTLMLQDGQSSMSNNVNFNDSSKLIRLQASHFDQQASTLSSAAPHHLLSHPHHPHQQQSSMHQNKLPAQRSQSVLFSQHPFGFVTDSSKPNSPSAHEKRASLEQLRSVGSNEPLNFVQQQRRPRPPKRQQIPIGGSGATTTQLSNEPAAMGASFQATSPDQMGTLPFTESDALAGGLPASRSQGSRLAHSRPLVATTVNFQPEFMQQQQQQQQQAAAHFTSTQPTNFDGSGVTGRRVNSLSQGQQQRLVNSQTASAQADERTNLNSHHSSLPPTATTAATITTLSNQQLAHSAPATQSHSIANSNLHSHSNSYSQSQSHPHSQSRSSASNAVNEQVGTVTPAATTTNQEQDPQSVANRYLNSAIDALEAGQPFGTVDYDFDILNDNSTERRSPTSSVSAPNNSGQQVAPAQSAGSESRSVSNNRNRQVTGGAGSSNLNRNANSRNNNQSLLFNLNAMANANKQRLQAANLSADEDDESSISLTNGQPTGSGGASSSSSSSDHKQLSSLRPGARVGAGGRVTGGGQIGRQQQLSRDSLSQPNGVSQTPLGPPQVVGPAHSQASDQQQSRDRERDKEREKERERDQQQQQQQPTKKSRPTNKKIIVNHEQAIANNRASIEPARRPEALFSTPIALQTATKCDNRVCRLPDCKCGDTMNPANLEPKVIPQVILLTFDDAVNDLNWELYEELFTGKTNPNGCPILATFYVSHEWTDYGQVQTLYSRGHEIASHSITHSFGEKFSKSQWFKEVNGQREILNMYGGVKMNDVRGMRAPFLQIGGNKMFEMLYDANFTYDSSMPIFENSPPLWPYTLDYQLAHECMITPCPTKSFPGVWEVGMTMWVDLRGGRCSMGDACTNPGDEDGVYEMLMKNFNRHYKSNRAPFGLFYHSAWFNTVHHRRGFLRFMGTVNSLPDVFFVTNWQMLQWMRQPTPISEINTFEPWQCPAKNDRPPPCFHPSVCNVKSEHGTRFMKTCQPCPANQQYPWVGSTGFKGKQAAAQLNGSG